MNIGDQIKLPEISMKPAKEGCGTIYHVVEKQIDTVVHSIETRRINLFVEEKIYITKSGHRLLIDPNETAQISNDISGVLRTNSDSGKLEWSYHKKLEELEAAFGRGDTALIKDEIVTSWNGKVKFPVEKFQSDGSILQEGLRPPQVAALHAIISHWTLEIEPATVVMPTGTGKTETMLGVFVQMINETVVIAVPTQALLQQTICKFERLGLLHNLGVLPSEARCPIVGVFNRRPKIVDDLAWVKKCNVVIGLVSTLAQGTSVELLPNIASQASHLIIDEAHHIAAKTWSDLRGAFLGKPILQLTATPFRRDGKQIDGRIIFNYPLSRAQEDGYFKKIHFVGVNAFGEEDIDEKIAEASIKQLRLDLGTNFDHLVMARCDSVTRADSILAIYKNLGSEFNPELIHHNLKLKEKRRIFKSFENRTSRIIICVDMLGEGFDLPNLKIAALHDPQKSIAPLLQFTGRFTRTSGNNLGDATVIASMDDPETPTALERLYSEDADWNKLLADYSFEAISEQERLLNFLKGAERLDVHDPSKEVSLDPRMFRPLYSTLVYSCSEFHPRKFYETISNAGSLQGAWLFEQEHVLIFITVSQERPKWVRSKKVKDVYWSLYVLYYNPEQNLLYIHSTDKEGLHEGLAKTVGNQDVAIIRGDQPFRVLGGVTRLLLQNVGLKARGRRNLRYSMFSGVDVVEAISPAQRARSTRANVFGSGFEHGGPVNIGCSYKGRVWTRESGHIAGFAKWCTSMGIKLLDESISVDDIISGALTPKEIQQLPDVSVLSIEWPSDIWCRPEERVTFIQNEEEISLSECDIYLERYDQSSNSVRFGLRSEKWESTFEMSLLTTSFGFTVRLISGPELLISMGSRTAIMATYFEENPPVLLFVDGSELEGHFLIEQKNFAPPQIPADRLLPQSWNGVDIKEESIWKNGVERTNSVQYKTAQKYVSEGYEVVFDDDGSGEAADLICLRETNESIELELVHCKFSHTATPGHRLSDVVEVTSQAVRAVRWLNRFDDLCKHLRRRSNLLSHGRQTRYIHGDERVLRNILRASTVKPIKLKIVAVQPGLKKEGLSDSQITTVLSAAHGYLVDTAEVGLVVHCS